MRKIHELGYGNKSAITIKGNDADRFSITQDNASGQSIPNGQSATVTVSFSPNNDSSKYAVISIPSNDVDEDPLEVILTGGQVVEAFVSRFYTISLGRDPEPQGLDYWATSWPQAWGRVRMQATGSL